MSRKTEEEGTHSRCAELLTMCFLVSGDFRVQRLRGQFPMSVGVHQRRGDSPNSDTTGLSVSDEI